MADRPHVRVDPSVRGGSPVIDGTRIDTLLIAGFVATGAQVETVIDWYPSLDRPSVLLACWYETRHGRYGGREMKAARKAWREWAAAWKPTAASCPDPPEVSR